MAKTTTQKTMSKSQTSKTPTPGGPILPPAGDQDKACYVISIGMGITGAVLTLGMWFVSISNLVRAFTSSPIDWLTAVGMVVLLVASFFVARLFFWIAILAPIMLAAQTRSYGAQEKFCNIALKYRKALPAGAAWASIHGLMQLMISRKQYKEAIALGTSEYDQAAAKNPKDQNLAPVCTQVALAHQMQNDHHASILWNERAVEAFIPLIESMEKAGPQKKSKMIPDSSQFVDQARTQLAGIYCNLATSYFNVGNYGKAKSNYAHATELAMKLPDSNEKQQIVQVSREAVARLKHW